MLTDTVIDEIATNLALMLKRRDINNLTQIELKQLIIRILKLTT